MSTSSFYVNDFISKNSSEIFDGTIPNEKEIFKGFAEKAFDLCIGSVSGWEYDIDYYGIVFDFYEEIWKAMIKPLLESNKQLLEELSKTKATDVSPILVVPQPKVDEEKLNELAYDYACDVSNYDEIVSSNDISAFKAGYRKAMEEKRL